MKTKLKPCPACSKTIAIGATSCPHCGKSFTSLGRIVLGVVAVLLVLAIVVMAF